MLRMLNARIVAQTHYIRYHRSSNVVPIYFDAMAFTSLPVVSLNRALALV